MDCNQYILEVIRTGSGGGTNQRPVLFRAQSPRDIRPELLVLLAILVAELIA